MQSSGLSWEAIATIGGLLLALIGMTWTIIWGVAQFQIRTINATLGRVFEKIEKLLAETSAINERCKYHQRREQSYEQMLIAHEDTLVEHEHRISSLEEATDIEKEQEQGG